MIQIKTSAMGAELKSVIKDGKELMHDGVTGWPRVAPILFPIVGKSKNDTIIIDGTEYEMKQHGLARGSEFEQIGEHSYKLVSNEETKKIFPHNFELYISYTVVGDTVTTNCKVVNTGDKEIELEPEPMSFGFGFHPAFACDYSSGEYYIEFDNTEDEAIINQLTKDGYVGEEPVDTSTYIEGNRLPLNAETFENDVIILSELKSKVVTLRTKDEKIVTVNIEDFPYLGIWSQEGAPFVCIEPWKNTADRENATGVLAEKENVITIEPREEFECSMSVEYLVERVIAAGNSEATHRGKGNLNDYER
ncbi:MAG: aldose 1-epimerase family protein [Oscillospiraceae bacterium]|nr:aldose 1-epimerase family protein [Oscillospiraceae bacterium]